MNRERDTSTEVGYGAADLAPSSAGEVSQARRIRLYLVLDLVLSTLAAALAVLLWNLTADRPVSISWYADHLHWVPVLSGATFLVFALSGLYMLSSQESYRASFFRIMRGLAVMLGMYYTIYFFAPRHALPRLVVLFHVMLTFLLVIISRRVIAWLFEQPELQQNVILIGNPTDATMLRQVLDEHAMSGIRVVGLYPIQEEPQDERTSSPNEQDQHVKILDPERELFRYASRMNVTGLVVFREQDAFPDNVLNQLVDCFQKGMSITSGLDLSEKLSGRLPVSYARSYPERMFPSRKENGLFYRFVKRAMDVLGAVSGLLLFAPLLPVIAAAIKLTSRGPVFFRQQRTGQHGQPFELIKLRTMVENAEEDTGAQWAQENDPRITPIGTFLRLTHLDEFPQFWNVLKGDMSLVGPRPERPEIEEELTEPNPFFKLRHSVKPGVTGWATIKNQYVDSTEKAERRLEYDLYYIEHQSFWLDLHILFETVWELITFGGR